MTSETEQWIYKVGAVVVSFCLVACFLAMIVSIFYFGDGEGLRILDGLTGPILGILASVAALLAPRSISSAVAAVKATSAGSGSMAVPSLPAPAPTTNEVASDPGGVTIPAAVSGPGVD